MFLPGMVIDTPTVLFVEPLDDNVCGKTSNVHSVCDPANGELVRPVVRAFINRSGDCMKTAASRDVYFRLGSQG